MAHHKGLKSAREVEEPLPTLFNSRGSRPLFARKDAHTARTCFNAAMTERDKSEPLLAVASRRESLYLTF